ncbi:MAG: hypothetical protein Q8S13_05215, partial [Dehalococcoidia bacterium]|nr:hypothetical protein [Dehalococcoidia bacterium]
NNVKAVRRTSGTWGSVFTWTQTANDINGLDVVFTNHYRLVVSGVDSSARPTVWTLKLASTTDTWTEFFIVIQAESDEQITFQAPFIHFPDVYRLTFVEKFAGTPAYTRTFWTATVLAVLSTGGDWEWLDPVPLDNTTEQGYAVAHKPGAAAVAYLSRPGRLLSASLIATSLDMSADLVGARIVESGGLEQEGELVFDNSGGAYAGPPAPIAVGRDVELGLGYGSESSPPPRQSIAGWEYQRVGGRSRLVLRTSGVQYWLLRSRPRTTVQYTSAAAVDVMRGAAARAGLRVLNLNPSTRATAFLMAWSVHPHQTSLGALEALIELVADSYVASTAGFFLGVTEHLASDAIDYTYGTDHAIYGSRTRDEGAVSFVEILAEGVIGQAFDFPVMDEDRPIQDRRRDPPATASADASAHATARLRRSVLGKDLGELVTPPNCGLEVGDVVAYSDALVNAAQLKARVQRIETRYRRARPGRQPVYEQVVGLGGV